MDQHFLQSEAWEKFQEALGRRTIRRSGDGWSYLAIVEHGGGLTRLYVPYGPTVASLKALDEALIALRRDAKECQASFLRLQPTGIMLSTDDARPRTMRAIHYSQPEATRVVDLVPDFNDIVGAMSSSERNVYRNIHKKGVTYHVSKNPDDIELIIPLLENIAQRNNIAVHGADYIRKQAQTLVPDSASIHYMELDGKPVSVSLAFEDDDTCYYAHAGNSPESYKLNSNTALLVEMMNYAKKNGKKHFDLYGIAPTDDPRHPWAGVTRFKARFGGHVVHYNPTYDLPVKRFRYLLYMLLRSLKRHM